MSFFLELIGCLLDLLYAVDRHKEDKKAEKKKEETK